MKILYTIAAAATFLGAAALPQQVSKVPVGKEGGVKREFPFACDRLALNAAERKRHFEELGPALRTMVRGARELAGGYEFEFSAEPAVVQMVGEWVAGEHRCCPFFDIEMRLDRENGPLWLRLSGREGTKEFIRSDFQKWLSAANGLR